jgi:hypothetical protein
MERQKQMIGYIESCLENDQVATLIVVGLVIGLSVEGLLDPGQATDALWFALLAVAFSILTSVRRERSG